MTSELLNKLKEVETAAGSDWLLHFQNVKDVADLRAVLLKWNIAVDDATADEAIILLNNKVREIPDEDLEKLANGGAIKFY